MKTLWFSSRRKATSRFVAAISIAGFALFLAACGGAATSAPSVTQAPATIVVEATVATVVTQAPAPTTAPQVTLAPTLPPPQTATPPPLHTPTFSTSTPVVETRVLELEWPPLMRLGDSDVIRLTLLPSTDGYLVTTEFPDHTTLTQTVPVARPAGYDLSAIARLDGVNFTLSPQAEQSLSLPISQTVTYRWTLTPRAPGQHRLNLTLTLRWTPLASGAPRESQIYSKGLTIQVASVLGLTQAQALLTGFVGLLFGSSLSLAALAYRVRLPRVLAQTFAPNRALALELNPAITLNPHEITLLQTLFRRYARLVLETEFRSGYSGARTFLARPIHADSRADAHTIIKLGDRAAIEREYRNYETYVKDTLPPLTARIQEPPITLPSPVRALAKRRTGEGPGVRAVLRYTFIAEPDRQPISLRTALLADPDPALLEKLFATFGPNWWMQRRAHTFRLAQEYDSLLPAHLVLEPAPGGRRKILKGDVPPSNLDLRPGDILIPRGFPLTEPRADGSSWTLSGVPRPGQPPLRVRWLSPTLPSGHTAARVTATRETTLRALTADLDPLGLPDPLVRLPALLDETLTGTRSTIHGDLNLENILVGPGGFVWLIDFAQTRDGHPLADFAHLEADLIAHLLAPQLSPSDYLALLPSLFTFHAPPQPSLSSHLSLLLTLHAIAHRCLFNPAHPREYHLALYFATLGALKYANLTAPQRHLLYLTAAYLSQIL